MTISEIGMVRERTLRRRDVPGRAVHPRSKAQPAQRQDERCHEGNCLSTAAAQKEYLKRRSEGQHGLKCAPAMLMTPVLHHGSEPARRKRLDDGGFGSAQGDLADREFQCSIDALMLQKWLNRSLPKPHPGVWEACTAYQCRRSGRLASVPFAYAVTAASISRISVRMG